MMTNPTSSASPGHEAERDVVLLCNPRAGGRWKELAGILDSEEARWVRWIVTDSIEDIGPALGSLGRSTRLLCVYGGDGTIQRILDSLLGEARGAPMVAFIGGGTMNVTARWCGMSTTPQRAFRAIVRAYKSGELLYREVPILEVRQGEHLHRGFTFGMGPIIRVLNEYENSQKGGMAALAVVAQALSAATPHRPAQFDRILDPLEAEIVVDGRPLPYRRFAGLFANNTGKLHIGVEPFPRPRGRDRFYYLAYACTVPEVAILLPFLIQGFIPIDPKSLIKPVSTWKQVAMAYLGKGAFPTDPRYLNDTAQTMEIRSDERFYTVDGEVLPSTGQPIQVSLGPTVQLAVSAAVGIGGSLKLVTSGR
jgi:diacylglycerol kinase family enzyme